MKKRLEVFLVSGLLVMMVSSTGASATCTNFSGSTMTSDPDHAVWRTDYPVNPKAQLFPWKAYSFQDHPAEYMAAVLDSARPYFQRVNDRLVGNVDAPWWIAPWMDFGPYGREPSMGLTKERGPDPNDLSKGHPDGYQVWAVGFYNDLGAGEFATIFQDPCNPAFPEAVSFPEGTVSIKFLFTDADPSAVHYLAGASTYLAKIDARGAGDRPMPVDARSYRNVRLLQFDIAVKDADATETGWVFGTFAWIGPAVGDGLFDNLVPVSLQWGNDPQVYDLALTETWTNKSLAGVFYGWEERPTLGFHGRANGPADNIRSSCLSCHAAARIPRAEIGILDYTLDMDTLTKERIERHVDRWFQNIGSGEVFEEDKPDVIANVDYSLQLTFGFERMCKACEQGSLKGSTPEICVATSKHISDTCGPKPAQNAGVLLSNEEDLEYRDFTPPPRQ